MYPRFFSYLLTLLVVLILIFSCREEDNTNPVSDPYPGYWIKYPDTTFYSDFPNAIESYSWDADNDGTNDFKIETVYEHEVGLYYCYKTSISCLNPESFLVTDSIKDTTFISFNRDTTWQNGKTDIAIKEIITHERKKSIDSVNSVQILHYVIPFKERTEMSYKNYKSGNFYLVRQSYIIFYSWYQESPDLDIHQDTYYEFPQLFPIDRISYIGIKKMVHGKEKTGWVKLLLIGYQTISVLEIAIQK